MLLLRKDTIMKKRIKNYIQELKFNLVYLKDGWVSFFKTFYRIIRLNFRFYLHKNRIKELGEFESNLLDINTSTGSSLWGLNHFVDAFHDMLVYKIRPVIHKEDLEFGPKSNKFLFT